MTPEPSLPPLESATAENRTGFILPDGPGRWRIDRRRVAPESLFATTRLVREIASRSGWLTGKMLDLGCGTKPYREVFASSVAEHVGVDMPITGHGYEAIDAFSDALALPFRTASFDSVLCTEVLEHVPDPMRTYGEIARVLRPGGHALVTTPFMYRVHEAPYDFFRYTPYAHRRLAENAGLIVERISSRGGYLTVYFDLLMKGMIMVVAVAGKASQKIFGAGRGLRLSSPVRFGFDMMQRIFTALIGRERLAADTYTLGYIVELRKPD